MSPENAHASGFNIVCLHSTLGAAAAAAPAAKAVIVLVLVGILAGVGASISAGSLPAGGKYRKVTGVARVARVRVESSSGVGVGVVVAVVVSTTVRTPLATCCRVVHLECPGHSASGPFRVVCFGLVFEACWGGCSFVGCSCLSEV